MNMPTPVMKMMKTDQLIIEWRDFNYILTFIIRFIWQAGRLISTSVF